MWDLVEIAVVVGSTAAGVWVGWQIFLWLVKVTA